jgi:hypothetical protein
LKGAGITVYGVVRILVKVEAIKCTVGIQIHVFEFNFPISAPFKGFGLELLNVEAIFLRSHGIRR